MPDWVKDLRDKAKKTVTSPISGRDFVIRKLTSSELIEAGISPLISEKKPEKFDNDLAALAWVSSRADKVTIEQTRYVLLNGVIEPTIAYGNESNVSEGSVHARWISEDEQWLFISVLEFSGIASNAHREELARILKNANGSETSPLSADTSANSRASS